MTPQAFSYATLGSNGMIYIPPFGLNESIDYMLKMDPTTYAITKIKLDVDGYGLINASEAVRFRN